MVAKLTVIPDLHNAFSYLLRKNIWEFISVLKRQFFLRFTLDSQNFSLVSPERKLSDIIYSLTSTSSQ